MLTDLYNLTAHYSGCLSLAAPNRIPEHLTEELPYIWTDAYIRTTNRLTDICIIPYGSFEYIFDDYESLESRNLVPYDPLAHSRLVAVLGKSSPQKIKRDDYRLKGWLGPTETVYGKEWDKGHYIAHSLGGAVDGLELNVFPQRRDLNRGWSEPGKLFRKMEKFCFNHAGTFCFNRPIYMDQSFKPAFYEFGLLKPDNQLWIEVFDNR